MGVTGWVRRSPWLNGLPREVAVLSVVSFCVALGFGIVGPAIPIFAKEFGVSAFWATAVVSVFALMRLVGALPAGWLVDRTGERITLSIGLSIVAISSIHLLQRFLEAGDYDNGKLYALVVMHMAFVVSALLLTYIDKIASDKKGAGGH